MRGVIVGLFAATTLVGCGDPDPEAGHEVYTQTCATCHGEEGDQGTVTGSTAAPDLADEVPEQSDDALITIIENGFGEMPAQAVNPGKDMDNLVAYLRQKFPGGDESEE